VFCAVSADNPKPLQHEAQVAFWCGKVNQHVDLKTGHWITDKNGRSMCATSKEQVLRYCKHTYPSLQISNIVEANSPITIDKWCDPKNVNCTGTKDIVTYRCLVGPFEADALLVPKGCSFGHLHKGSKCKSHDVWRSKAEGKCDDQAMKLEHYGVLTPCGTGMFTGVEYVCCPKNMTVEKPKENPVMKLVGGREDVDLPRPTEHPISLIEKLEKEIKKYPKHLSGKSMGCDHKKYHRHRQSMEIEHRNRMSNVIKEWENAEKRYNALKNEDPAQAEQMITGVMDRFKKIVGMLEKQAKVERFSIHEEHIQCMQIDLNDKKNKVLRSFLKALKKSPPDENAILKAMRKFMNVSTEDRIHNHHHFERMVRYDPDNADKLRKNFQNHLKHINEQVNFTMTLLYKVPKIARKFFLELPSWVPKPQLPTEKPTTQAKTEAVKEDEKIEMKSKNKERDENRHTSKHHKHDHVKDFLGMSSQKKQKKHHKNLSKEDEPEDEEYFEDPHSPATFAVVIGLSCGALVIMVIIIITMAMRRSRRNNPTRTVLVDPDTDGNTEKQHLANLQQNGYENPIYKLSSTY
ncbi:hypothetical protein QZH41_013301, partial [Actinostola sp. cb2023]